jgi:hypothetical protein
MKIRTQPRAGGQNLNHNGLLAVRTALKAGGQDLNHNEAQQTCPDPEGGPDPPACCSVSTVLSLTDY